MRAAIELWMETYPDALAASLNTHELMWLHAPPHLPRSVEDVALELLPSQQDGPPSPPLPAPATHSASSSPSSSFKRPERLSIPLKQAELSNLVAHTERLSATADAPLRPSVRMEPDV